MKSQAVMFKWRVLNSSLCAFINFVGYCVKNLHLKCIWNLFSVYLLEVQKNAPFGSWIHQSWFCVLLVLLICFCLSNWEDVCVFSLVYGGILETTGSTVVNSNKEIQHYAAVYISLGLAIYLFLYQSVLFFW